MRRALRYLPFLCISSRTRSDTGVFGGSNPHFQAAKMQEADRINKQGWQKNVIWERLRPSALGNPPKVIGQGEEKVALL